MQIMLHELPVEDIACQQNYDLWYEAMLSGRRPVLPACAPAELVDIVQVKHHHLTCLHCMLILYVRVYVIFPPLHIFYSLLGGVSRV